jgi:hypothetical protein
VAAGPEGNGRDTHGVRGVLDVGKGSKGWLAEAPDDAVHGARGRNRHEAGPLSEGHT